MTKRRTKGISHGGPFLETTNERTNDIGGGKNVAVVVVVTVAVVVVVVVVAGYHS